MKDTAQTARELCRRGICALFMAGAAFVLVFGLRFGTMQSLWTLPLFAAGLAAAWYIRRTEVYIAPRAAFIILLLLCFAVKLCWVLAVSVPPESDYYTFYTAAEELAEGGRIPEDSYLVNYLALFPHIFGYSSFLALVFGLFGASPMTAAAANAVLSTIAMACIYGICRGRSYKAAVWASLLWIFYPSQTVYNMYVLSEPYYTALLLAVLWLLSKLYRSTVKGCNAVQESGGKLYCVTGKRCTAVQAALLGLAAVLLGIMDQVRPLGAVALIALALTCLLHRAPLRRSIAALLILALGLYAAGTVNGLAFRRAVGTEPSSSLGYSVYVGLNYGSSGGWNQYDSAKLSEVMAETEPFDAEAVQERMLDAAAQRFSELSPAQLVKLAVKKLILLWAEDDACLSYSQGRLSQTGLAAGLCNAFYFLLWLLSGLAALRQFRAGPRGASPLLTLCFLFVLGLTAAHLLTECAIRYHYSGSALLCITAAHCLDKKRLHTV